MNESATIIRYLITLLRSDPEIALATEGVYHHRADPGAAMPYVVVSDRTSVPWYGIGRDNRQGSDVTVSVKVIGQGDSIAPLVPIANRIDALLESDEGAIPATDSTPQLDVYGWHKQTDINYPDPSTAAGGQRINHLGGVYRATLGITR